jgi:hypothetical protein
MRAVGPKEKKNLFHTFKLLKLTKKAEENYVKHKLYAFTDVYE